MKDASLTWKIVVSLLLIVFLILCFNPFNLLMTPLMLASIIVGIITCFSIFAAFIWQEQARDEREIMNRMLASRTAYLTGAGVLVIGIVYQSMDHAIDPWLLFTLGMMIIAKVAGNIRDQF